MIGDRTPAKHVGTARDPFMWFVFAVAIVAALLLVGGAVALGLSLRGGF